MMSKEPAADETNGSPSASQFATEGDAAADLSTNEMAADISQAPDAVQGWRGVVRLLAAAAITLYTLAEVNLAILPPLASLATFALLGVVLCFLPSTQPKRATTSDDERRLHGRGRNWRRVMQFVGTAERRLLLMLAVGCFGYVCIESDALLLRAGNFNTTDRIVAGIGLLVVLEAARRTLGWALPILALVFIVYALVGRSLPDALFPHRGYAWNRIAVETFLKGEGVFGTALRVMFNYVLPFVMLGAAMEVSGATSFIMRIAERLFGRSRGGPAKIAIVGSGLLGSLSGSAVANTVTSGTFTIPMMRSAGFPKHIAAGIEAAASSGGALAPPVMGAGAYMMLEMIQPQVQLTEILRAAMLPAILFYLSLIMLVHLYAKRFEWLRLRGKGNVGTAPSSQASADADLNDTRSDTAATQTAMSSERVHVPAFEGVTFVASLVALVTLLLAGRSPMLAATATMALTLMLAVIGPRFGLRWRSRIATLAAMIISLAGARLAAGATDHLPSTWGAAVSIAAPLWLLVGAGLPGFRKPARELMRKVGRTAAPLVAAAACVGVIIAIILMTGVGTSMPNAIIPLAERSRLLALMAIMGCSLVLGMGLPSAVCYLLMATLIGQVLGNLGVPPLAAHLFVFYFGMMSMVTPPVALAGYAAASIAEAGIIRTSFAAFRFALVGFTLPYMFIYRPALLLMNIEGGPASPGAVAYALFFAIAGIASLAAALAGWLVGPLGWFSRIWLFVAAACALVPDQKLDFAGLAVAPFDMAGVMVLAAVWLANRWRRQAMANKQQVVGGD